MYIFSIKSSEFNLAHSIHVHFYWNEKKTVMVIFANSWALKMKLLHDCKQATTMYSQNKLFVYSVNITQHKKFENNMYVIPYIPENHAFFILYKLCYSKPLFPTYDSKHNSKCNWLYAKIKRKQIERNYGSP